MFRPQLAGLDSATFTASTTKSTGASKMSRGGRRDAMTLTNGVTLSATLNRSACPTRQRTREGIKEVQAIIGPAAAIACLMRMLMRKHNWRLTWTAQALHSTAKEVEAASIERRLWRRRWRMARMAWLLATIRNMRRRGSGWVPAAPHAAECNESEAVIKAVLVSPTWTRQGKDEDGSLPLAAAECKSQGGDKGAARRYPDAAKEKDKNEKLPKDLAERMRSRRSSRRVTKQWPAALTK